MERILYLEAINKDYKKIEIEEKEYIMQLFDGLQKETKLQCLELFNSENFVELGELINSNRFLGRKIKSIVDSYENQYILILDRIVQNFNVYNKLLQNRNNKNDFESDVKWIICKHKKAGNILSYLLKNPHSQFTNIQNVLNIPKSSLSELMKVLVDYSCVKKMKTTKYVFFSLTVEGKRYVTSHYPDSIKEVFVIEQELFGSDFKKKYAFASDIPKKMYTREIDRYVNILKENKLEQGVSSHKEEYQVENEKKYFDELIGDKNGIYQKVNYGIR